MKWIIDCEDSARLYIEFPDIRLIFENGEYKGYYNPILSEII